jgi:hypothetical protein
MLLLSTIEGGLRAAFDNPAFEEFLEKHLGIKLASLLPAEQKIENFNPEGVLTALEAVGHSLEDLFVKAKDAIEQLPGEIMKEGDLVAHAWWQTTTVNDTAVTNVPKAGAEPVPPTADLMALQDGLAQLRTFLGIASTDGTLTLEQKPSEVSTPAAPASIPPLAAAAPPVPSTPVVGEAAAAPSPEPAKPSSEPVTEPENAPPA